MRDELKEEIMVSTIASIETLALAALTTDSKYEKVVVLEEMRSSIDRLAMATDNDFNHPDVYYYEHVSTSLLEMGIVTLRNIAEVMNEGNVDECVNNADEVFYMLDRWEKAKMSKNG